MSEADCAKWRRGRGAPISERASTGLPDPHPPTAKATKAVVMSQSEGLPSSVLVRRQPSRLRPPFLLTEFVFVARRDAHLSRGVSPTQSRTELESV